jgi:phospholipid/cholesterol/gamma-HCH transport system substrate-binding protein
MKRKIVDLYIGLFVMAGLVAIASMILAFSGRASRNRYKVAVTFDNVAGLIEEAPVRYKGVECGSVGRIAIVQRRETSDVAVRVDLLIDKNITLRAGDTVRVTPVSFLGEMAVQIVPGPIDETELPKNGSAEMAGTSPIGLLDPLARLIGPLPEVMENIKRLTDAEGPLTKTAEGLSQAVNQTLPDVANDIRVSVRTVASSTENLLSENREQIRGLIAGIESTLESSSGFIENLNRLTSEEGAVTATVKDLRGAVDDFRRVTRALHPIMANVRHGEGGLGKLVNDESWYENFNKLLLAMRQYGIHFEKGYDEEQKRIRLNPPEPTAWVR